MESKKILVAEDERPMARALELKLTHAGFTVFLAGNGADALSLIDKEHPDLILLDLIMPKQDGFSVLEALKKKGDRTPVIVLSNLSQEEDENRAKELGARGFFIKSNTPIAEIVEHTETFLASQA